MSQTKNARPSILKLPREELQHGMIKPEGKKGMIKKTPDHHQEDTLFKDNKLTLQNISHFKCNFLLSHGFVYVLIHHCILDCHSTKDRKCLYEKREKM